ncbi:MAG: sulfatase-like hydrolase/transferase [Candidatus Neomarinimicrobiota bacterium]
MRQRVAAVFHILALLYFAVFVHILLLGGFRFHLGELQVSATQLRNPILFTAVFILLGKTVNPSVTLKNTPLGRFLGWIRDQGKRLGRYRNRGAAFWGSVILLNTLLFLPLLIAKSGTVIPALPSDRPRGWYDLLVFFLIRENPDFFRVSVDFYFMITVLALLARTRWYHPIRRMFTVWYFLLLAYQVYAAASLVIFGQEPVIYSDILLLKDGIYLVSDIWSWKLFDSMVRTLFWGSLLITLIHHAFKSIGENLSRFPLRYPALIPGVLLWVLIFLMGFRYDFQDPRPIARYITPGAVQNVWESKRGLSPLSGDSLVPDGYHFEALELKEKPNVYLFMVESYGKILASHPDLRNIYLELMKSMETQLSENGWYTTTNYSAAPVSGGRSWLSMATVLSGIRIDSEALYRLLIRRIPDYHHLVRFLRHQGYQTLVLQPTMRPRPGFSFDMYENFYDYDRWIYYDSLNYGAEEYGWGMIPDQYSLNYAHEQYLREVQQPYFFSFMTVTSHAPWYDLPPYLDDWTVLNDSEFRYSDYVPFPNLDYEWPRTWRGVARHVKKTLKVKDLFEPEDYVDHISYQFQVIGNYVVEKAPENSIVLIMGDHQPPVLTGTDSGHKTPIHIISRDRGFINSFGAYGFVPGGYKDPHQAGSIKHEAVFSMVIRSLVNHNGTVEYLPDGLPLSVLRQ